MADPKDLTGTQKVAVLIMTMDRDRASEVLKQFNDSETEEIMAEIVRMRRVAPDVTERVIEEFHSAASLGRMTTRGGRDLAEELLESSFGAERAAGLMSRVTNSMAGKAFEFLDEAEPAQVSALLTGEMPQTVALIIAHLRPPQAAAILRALAEPLRVQVAECIAKMTTATPETVALVAQSLKVRAAAVVAPRAATEVVGGIQPLVDIINRADVTTEKSVLEGLDSSNPDLAEEIRSRLLTFADIVRLEARDVQQVLRGIDIAVLAIAMKGSSDAVQQKITENLSERNRELLADEIGVAGAVRKSQVEEARSEIVRAIRELADTGAITMHRSDEDALVD